jgi:Bardet-Biedl syndrome 9 protein
LSSTIEIILALLKIRFKMSEDEYEALKMHLSPFVDDESEHGWEEITNASMTHLLKTSLAKGGKPSTTNINSQIKALTDISKLKQHITLVCERISKGFKIEM